MTETAFPTWRDKAACLGREPELWFPLPTQSSTEARKTCGGCPVRKECATAANRAGESAGIWAGFRLPDERDALRAYLGIGARTCDRCGGPIAVGNRLAVCYDCTSSARSDRGDVREAREHIQRLRDQRFALTEMAAASGVCVATLSRIVRGVTDSASNDVLERVLALDADTIRRAAVNA